MANYQYQNIMYPKQVIPDVKRYLIPRYIHDYGVENRNHILSRFDHTIFIFDSNPILTKEFFDEHLLEIKDYRFKIRSEIEYLDYLRVKKFVEQQAREAFDIALLQNRYVFSYEEVSDLWDLDFESYLPENDKLDNILERRKHYENDCLEKGINCVRDPEVIKRIVYCKNILKQLSKEELIHRSVWGKRLKREIKKDYSFSITDEGLSEIVFDDKNCGTAGYIEVDDEEERYYVYIPLIQNKDFPSLDHILFHELRHRVETEDHNGGLLSFDNQDYYYINELHTETNALLDEKEKKCIYFGGGDSSHISLYQYLFKEAGSFFDDYQCLLNYLAFSNDIEGLEYAFGKDFLQEMEESLSKKAKEKYKRDHQEKRI